MSRVPIAQASATRASPCHEASTIASAAKEPSGLLEKRRFPRGELALQSLISQPRPLVERISKRITFLIGGSLLQRQPAQDGGKDEDARTQLGWSAQLDVDLVLVRENLALFRTSSAALQTLNRKLITSPSWTMYSLPSRRSLPSLRASVSPPALIKSS